VAARAPVVADQIKHREAVFVTRDRLAVDHARTHGQRGDRCGDQRKAGGEVIPRPRHELHAAAAAVRYDPKAVVLDFVNPARSGRRQLSGPRKARLKSGKGLLGANAAPQTYPGQPTVPGTQHDVDFMVKDNKRFADSGGWGWGAFEYDAASDAFSPATEADDPPQEHDAKCGFACHTIVQTSDYVFTEYGKR
jgi:Cytochrome P460